MGDNRVNKLRRRILKVGAYGAVFVAGGATGVLFDAFYVNTGENRAPPVLRRANGQQDDLILCDFHAHISNSWDREEVIEVLRSPGLIGLAYKPVEEGQESSILNFRQAIDWIHEMGLEHLLTELTPGKLARFGDGYFCNNEEVQGGEHSFILIGVDDYLPNYDDPFKLISDVHALGLERPTLEFSTPFVVNGLEPVSLDDYQRVRQIMTIMPKVDLVEILDSYAIDYLPLERFQTKRTNLYASIALEEIQTENGPFPTVGSDSHRDPTHALITGNYVEESKLQSMATLNHALRTGNFYLGGDPVNGPYTDKGDFTQTMVWRRIPLIGWFFD